MSNNNELPFEDNIIETMWYYEFKPIDCEQRDQFMSQVLSLCLTRTDDNYALYTMTQFKQFCAKTYKLEKEVYEELIQKAQNNVEKIDMAIENERLSDDKMYLNKYKIFKEAYCIYIDFFKAMYAAYMLRSCIMPDEN